MNYEVMMLLETIGAAAQPVMALALFGLIRAWSKFDKSIELLSQSVKDLSKRLERIENTYFKD